MYADIKEKEDKINFEEQYYKEREKEFLAKIEHLNMDIQAKGKQVQMLKEKILKFEEKAQESKKEIVEKLQTAEQEELNLKKKIEKLNERLEEDKEMIEGLKTEIQNLGIEKEYLK